MGNTIRISRILTIRYLNPQPPQLISREAIFKRFIDNNTNLEVELLSDNRLIEVEINNILNSVVEIRGSITNSDFEKIAGLLSQNSINYKFHGMGLDIINIVIPGFLDDENFETVKGLIEKALGLSN